MRAGSIWCVIWAVTASVSVGTADDVPEPTREEMLNPEWLETSLGELGINRLIKLYDDVDDPVLQKVRDALILSRPFLSEHPEEFRSQMQARLLSCEEPELQVFQELPADRVRARSIRASLNQAGDSLVSYLPIGRQGSHLVATPDGMLLALRWHDRVRIGEEIEGIEIRSGLTGESLRKLPNGDQENIPAGFSPDQTKVFSVSEDGKFHCWDISTGEELWSGVSGFGGYQRATCAFSPDERLVAVSSYTRQIAVFDVESGVPVGILTVAGLNYFNALAFLDDDTLVSCSNDGVVRHWAVSTGAIIEEFGLSADRLTRDGTKALSVETKEIEGRLVVLGYSVFDAMTGELIQQQVFKQPVHAREYDFDVAGEEILFATYRPVRQLMGFDAISGEPTCNAAISSLNVLHFTSVAGDRVISSGIDYMLCTWDLTREGNPRLVNDRVEQVEVSGDGTTAITNDDDTFRVWDTTTWQETAEFTHPGRGRHIAMSDDGSTVLYYIEDEIHSVNVATATDVIVKKFELGERERIRSIDLSGDGRVAAVSIDDDKTYVFAIATGSLLASTEYDPYISLSDDGSRLLLGARLLDLDTGEEQSFDQFRGARSAISGDGSRGTACSPFFGNVAWDFDEMAVLQGACHEVEEKEWDSFRVAISRDGRFAVSCGDNFNVYLYDTIETSQLAVVSIDGARISSIAISDDGSDLLIGTMFQGWHHYRFENLPP